MSQTKLGSFLEASTSVATSFVLGLVSQLVIFKFYYISVPFVKNLEMTAWFCLIGLVRHYIIRRWFNSFKSFTK